MTFMKFAFRLLYSGVVVVLATAAFTGIAADKKPRIAYVTNGVDPFWNVASAGVKQAAAEFGSSGHVKPMVRNY